MAELIPAPFRDLVTRLYLEPERQDTLFDLPRRSWYLPSAESPDTSVAFHGHAAGNPVGPASGPHTQMAQNLVLAYIAGSRIMELKTVQILDRLDIPRPCIDMANVGYNVEWSQELRVEESLREYVAGMMLIEMLRQTHPDAPESLRQKPGSVIYDISLGYDLEGIRSDKIQRYLDSMRDATSVIESLRKEIPSEFARARELEYPKQISQSVTLSTFHGCPTGEIERICEFLMGERDLDVIVKMNPPTLGKDHLEPLLNETLGYQGIRVAPHAYDACQTFDEAVEMSRRLSTYARIRGRRFGCKFSNTLEVINHRDFFTEENDVMFLSGPPLHAITMVLTERFRQALGPEFPISFSAGVTKDNFPGMVACGMVPITTCSDLLKTGGYGRLPGYLKNLEKEMNAVGAGSIEEYILSAHGQAARAWEEFGAEGQEAVRLASLFNHTLLAEKAQQDPRYHADKNSKPPKRIDSHLEIFDCITCNKCIPVCPNDANFTYPTPKVDFEYSDILVASDGSMTPGERHHFFIEKANQIANYQEFCNECGNCDTFCPEYGGPYIEKPGFYRTEKSWQEAAPRDGFVVMKTKRGGWIKGRIKGREYQLIYLENLPEWHLNDGVVEASISPSDHEIIRIQPLKELTTPHRVDMGIYHTLRNLWQGITDQSHLNQINAAWAAEAP